MRLMTWRAPSISPWALAAASPAGGMFGAAAPAAAAGGGAFADSQGGQI